jgi:hypothetical protein
VQEVEHSGFDMEGSNERNLKALEEMGVYCDIV